MNYVYEIQDNVLRRHPVIERDGDTATCGYTKRFICTVGEGVYFDTATEAIAEEYRQLQEEVREAVQDLEDIKATVDALQAAMPKDVKALIDNLECTWKPTEAELYG